MQVPYAVLDFQKWKVINKNILVKNMINNNYQYSQENEAYLQKKLPQPLIKETLIRHYLRL